MTAFAAGDNWEVHHADCLDATDGRPYHDPEWLRRAYHDEDMSIPEIAKLCGVTTTAVNNYRKRFEIPLKPRKRNLAEATCAWCGKTIYLKPCRLRNATNVFCPGWKCYGAWESAFRRGAAHPNYQSVDVRCVWCGKTITLPRATVRRQKYYFCRNTDCRSLWWSANKSGRNHPNYQTRIAVRCDQCGKRLWRRPNDPRKEHSFCDRDCYALWLKNARSGENNPFWQGGSTEGRDEWFRNGGREWRRLCRKRDKYTCRLCGMVFRKRDRGLHVHHKAGYTRYPELRSVVDNGVSVCKQCHEWLHSNDGELVRYRMEADVLCDMEQEYCEIARARIEHAEPASKTAGEPVQLQIAGM